MSTLPVHALTRPRHAWSDGRAHAPPDLLPLVDGHLRHLARESVRRERGHHPLRVAAADPNPNPDHA